MDAIVHQKRLESMHPPLATGPLIAHESQLCKEMPGLTMWRRKPHQNDNKNELGLATYRIPNTNRDVVVVVKATIHAKEAHIQQEAWQIVNRQPENEKSVLATVPKVYHIFNHEDLKTGHYFFVMEFHESLTFEQCRSWTQTEREKGAHQQARLGLLRCISIVYKAANTIDKTNLGGFTNSDIHRSNLVINNATSAKNEDSVTILDWGLCTHPDHDYETSAQEQQQLGLFKELCEEIWAQIPPLEHSQDAWKADQGYNPRTFIKYHQDVKTFLEWAEVHIISQMRAFDHVAVENRILPHIEHPVTNNGVSQTHHWNVYKQQGSMGQVVNDRHGVLQPRFGKFGQHGDFSAVVNKVATTQPQIFRRN